MSPGHFLEFVPSPYRDHNRLALQFLHFLHLESVPLMETLCALYVSNTHVGPISHSISGRGFPNWIRGA